MGEVTQILRPVQDGHRHSGEELLSPTYALPGSSTVLRHQAAAPGLEIAGLKLEQEQRMSQ
jgi:hypothetical protein